MKMKMKSKLLYVPIMAVVSVLVVKNSASPASPWIWTTPGPSGINLNRKMFTLSYRGGISFYPPYFSPTSTPWPSTSHYPARRYTTRPYHRTTHPPTAKPKTTRPYYTRTPYTTTRPYTTTTRPYTTRPYTTTTRPYTTTTTRPWTSAPPTRGVSVCLRYLTDSSSSLFTISPSSRNPLKVGLGDFGYQLTFEYGYYSLYLRPNLRFWSNIGPDIWTRVCLTVDSMKNVAQVFSGSNISIRKMLPIQYAWSGQPVIDFSGFDGQVTDLQMWDYPLSYREVFSYMTSGVYMPYRGSALTWSSISYSPRGVALLEDTYEWQAMQPISSSSGRRGRRPKGKKRTKEFVIVGESKREQL